MRNILKIIYLNVRAAFLNIAGFFFSGAAPAPASSARILFIRIDRIGDMVLSTPAIRAISEKYPSAELCVLASPVTAPLIASDPRVGSVVVWDSSLGWRGALAVVRKLREARFDLAIDPCADYGIKTAVIAFASGADVRAGYDLYGRGIFFNLKAALSAEREHFVEEAFGVLKLLGIERAGLEPELHISAGAGAEARTLLKASAAGETEYLVAIHPGGYYPSQRWSPAGFAGVIRALIEKHGAKVLLIGSGRERELVDDVADRACGGLDKKNIIKLINCRADVLAALIKKCRIFIGNNSGPLHIAAALKVPSVSTMGPTDPVKWSPRGAGQVVLKRMTEITAAMVIESAERLLRGH